MITIKSLKLTRKYNKLLDYVWTCVLIITCLTIFCMTLSMVNVVKACIPNISLNWSS